MNWFIWTMGALATYRLTVLLVRDVGPWRMFARLRAQARFTKLLTCVFCTSLWVAGVICVLLFCGGVIETKPVWFCILCSFSAITIILDRMFTVDHNPK